MIDAFGGITKAIKTSALKQRSGELDKRRTKDYWTTMLEMTARSFESYLISKLQDQNARNDYLANIVSEETWGADNSYPYPTAGELPAIRAAYDNFFNTIQTKETDDGNVAFYQNKEEYGAYGTKTKEFSALSSREQQAHKESIVAANDLLRGYKGSLLANNVSKDFKETGQTSLIGKKILSTEDLAVAAQVYRDPRYETLRYFFVKDGKIVSQTSVSSKLAGNSKISPSEYVRADRYIDFLSDQAAKLSADGVYLLHNHPSGDPSPSNADITVSDNLFYEFKRNCFKFLGHVILNHNKYSEITKTDKYSDIKSTVKIKEFKDSYSNNNP